MEQLKLCKDCKHGSYFPKNCFAYDPYCHKTQIQEPVLGEFISEKCIEVRSNGDKCGREGKWWEPKEEAGDMTAR